MAPQRSSDSWMWIVVLSATALVVAMAIAKGRTRGSPVEGKTAPAVSLYLLDGGKTMQLSERRGHVVVLDFWATWCQPCKRSMPDLQRIYKDYAGRGVELLAVNTDDGLGQNRDPAIREFFLQNHLDMPVALDDELHTATSAFGVKGFPTLVVVDRAGSVSFSHEGYPIDEGELRRSLDSALAQNTAKVQ